jgi:transposase
VTQRPTTASGATPYRRRRPERTLLYRTVQLNNKIRVIQRRAYGLRDEEYLRLKVLTCMLPKL